MRRVLRSGWILLAVVAAAGPARASAGAAPPPRSAVETRAQRLADALPRSGLAAALEAASVAAGVKPAEPAVVPTPALPRIPAAIRDLLAATQSARAASTRAVSIGSEQAARAHRDLMGVLWLPRARQARAFEAFEHEWGDVLSAVDRPALYGAARRMASAVDGVLARVPARAGVAEEAVGCDVADMPPLVCVGGEGVNTYTDDYAVQIDLGGDDVYLNGAGAADGTVGLAASVVVDLAGDDVYTAPGGALAQGSVTIAGVGMLVDAAGDDTYRAVQGQGLALAGVGLVADLAGHDRYLLKDTRAVASSIGQGYGVFGGLGMVLDGGGDDEYRIDAVSAETVVHENGLPYSTAFASGFGLGAAGGAGISWDAGGRDDFSVNAVPAVIPAHLTANSEQSQSLGLSYGVGIGPIGSGLGVHATGPGDTVRAQWVEVTAPVNGPSFADGFGYGIGDGAGALIDAAGDDVYSLDSISRSRMSVDLDETCVCDGAEIAARTSVAAISAIGYGSLAGVGFLRDTGGDDVYVARGLADGLLEIRDARAGDGGPGAAGRMTAGMVQVFAMGGGFFGGAGYLEDIGGDDRYQSDAEVRARTAVSAARPDLYPPSGVSFAGYASSYSQGWGGVGYGELRDLGGADVYTSTNKTSSSAVPPTEVVDSGGTSSVQAAVVGLLVEGAPGDVSPTSAASLIDVDAGALDSFLSVPQDTAAAGARGSAYWVDDGAGIAVGSAI